MIDRHYDQFQHKVDATCRERIPEAMGGIAYWSGQLEEFARYAEAISPSRPTLRARCGPWPIGAVS